MANYITIATLGPKRLRCNGRTDAQEIIEHASAHWQEQFDKVLADQPDLIVVPELCDIPEDYPLAGYADFCKLRGQRVQEVFARMARQNTCYVIYPTARLSDDGRLKNSCIVLDRAGQVAGTYDKNYLFESEHSEAGMSFGQDASVIECDFGRLGCVICFDLNFSALKQRYAEARPDMVVFSSLYYGGDLVQGAWAYDCRCHFVGAVAGLPSQVRNPYGEVLAGSNEYHDHATARINVDCCMAHLDFNADKLKALHAKYGKLVRIDTPSGFGSVLISSESDQVSAQEMADEFEIELLDEYLTRASETRRRELGDA